MSDSRELVTSAASGPLSQTSGHKTGSAKVVLASERTRSRQSILSDEAPKGNPFKMPPESDIFVLRDKERQRKKEERERQRKLHVHEKTTYTTRVNKRTAAMIHPQDSDDDLPEDEDRAVKEDPQFTLAVTRDRHVEKESLADYINKKREMFLIQYSLGVKRDEMRKLEEIASGEERKLELAEQYLEEDAAMFDEFLKENDKNSVEAIKVAENETKAKLEKVQEIKKINAQMMTIHSEISKHEDALKEYQKYKEFLESLTPESWLQQRRKEREARRDEKRRNKLKQQQTLAKTMEGSKPSSRGRRRQTKSPAKLSAKKEEDITLSDSSSDEEPQLYFTEPQQLLDIFAELEEQNLSLIQNSQETEEALEEMRQQIAATKLKMDKETKILREQINKLNKSIEREEAKAADLETKARMFSFGEYNQEDQEKMLGELNKKVEAVYRNCIGDNEANISTLQMLTNIENRLEELFEMIEMMPQDKVEAAEKQKEKERRLRLREEKMRQQKLHQEERVKKALERAKAEPKKQTGKRPVFRSEPPRVQKKTDAGDDRATREEEDYAYYFRY